MKAFKHIRRSVAISSLMFVPALDALSRADTVFVTPSNLNNWTLNSFDDNGNIVNSGPFLGTAQIVNGPAHPFGTGSVHLATPAPSPDPDPSSPGAGGAAAVATEAYDGTPLSSITSLSYSAYMANNGPVNNQQFPYLAVSINTGSVDNSGDAGALANTVDTLFFEPPYQQPSTGNPALPNQGATVLDQWQTWNAYTGGFWDNDNIGSPGANEGPSDPGVQSLATFLLDFPDATIENGGLPGLGGIAMQVGFADSTSTFDGYVDNFTIGVDGANTTYEFTPAVPEPTSLSLLGVGALALLRRRRTPQ